MLWLKSKTSLRNSGIFQGFTDWHSHILPGVDDGIKTMEDSLAVLEEYERLEFRKVWLTPHVMEDYPNETADLKNRFEELKAAWKGNVEIALASENMLDNLFEERLDKSDFLPIEKDKDHLLVETSYYTPPFAMDDMLESAIKKGYNLILAHPERYRYMGEKDYWKLKDKGMKFQVNLLSLTGSYGEEAKKKAEKFLNESMIDYFGSDIHKLSAFLNYIDNVKLKDSTLQKIRDIIGS